MEASSPWASSVFSSVKWGYRTVSEVSSNSGVGGRLWEPLGAEGAWEGDLDKVDLGRTDVSS